MIDEPWLARLLIEPLDRRKHDRAAFSCGHDRIDDFLKHRAAQQADREIGKTFVAIEPPAPAILGYYTLGAHSIDVSNLPAADQKRFPKRPVGAVYLSMIGVDGKVQRRGLGQFLLADVFARCVAVADNLGAAFIVLDALNEDAARLYRSQGFDDLPGQAFRMLISMAKVRAAVVAGEKAS
jgi:ribosomal protein S18 acetylase RimI-like enzyme